MLTHIELGTIVLLLLPWGNMRRTWRKWSEERKLAAEHRENEKIRLALEQWESIMQLIKFLVACAFTTALFAQTPTIASRTARAAAIPAQVTATAALKVDAGSAANAAGQRDREMRLLCLVNKAVTGTAVNSCGRMQ